MRRLISLFLFLVPFLGACENRALALADLKARVEKLSLQSIEPKAIFDLAKKSSSEIVLVNFWASWCLPCRHEFPDLLKFRTEWQKKNVSLEFVSVDFETDIPDAKSFLAEQKVDFTTYVRAGDDQNLIQTVDPKWSGALPTTFILNRKGEILFRFDGPVKFATLEAKVSSLLNQNSKGKSK